MPLPQMWQLSQQWYGDRLDHDYRPATASTLQGFLTGVGLVDEFWQLPG